MCQLMALVWVTVLRKFGGGHSVDSGSGEAGRWRLVKAKAFMLAWQLLGGWEVLCLSTPPPKTASGMQRYLAKAMPK